MKQFNSIIELAEQGVRDQKEGGEKGVRLAARIKGIADELMRHLASRPVP